MVTQVNLYQQGKKMKALSVEQIALSFFVSAAVLLALLSGMVWYASIQTEAATRSVTQSHIVLYSLEKILSATSRAESAQRSYYLSRNAIFINRRDAALREISENAKTVSELAVDNPLHTLQQEQALAPILERRIELFHHNQALFDALGKVGAYLDFEKVTADTEKIYSAILRMQEEQSSLLLQREAAELERLATGRFYFAGLSALMMLMFGLSSWLMKRAYDKQRVARSAEAEVRQQNVGLERTVFQQTDELSKTSENLHLLVEGIKDYALIMLDPEGRVLTWNSGAQRLKGYRAEEIIGQHFSIFHPPEDVQQDKAERMLQQTKQVGHYSIEGWRVRKDGSRFLASVNLTALRDEQGRLRGFAKVTRDITKFKQNEVLLNSEKNVLEIMSAGAPLADILESIARNV